MDIESWKAQLRKGAAELAVMAVLEAHERYGLEILEEVRGEEGLAISEGTIYPLLNRLQKDGKLRARWVEDPGASHPRKYYALTEEGRVFLQQMRDAWEDFRLEMERLLKEDRSHAR